MTLKRGFVSSQDLRDSIDIVRTKGGEGQREVSISLMDEVHENSVSRWTPQNAVPNK